MRKGFWLIICISFIGFVLISQTLKGYNNNKEINENLLLTIEKNNIDIEELEQNLKYQDSKEFVEKIAREKLGLIKNDEFIFIEK